MCGNLWWSNMWGGGGRGSSSAGRNGGRPMWCSGGMGGSRWCGCGGGCMMGGGGGGFGGVALPPLRGDDPVLVADVTVDARGARLGRLGRRVFPSAATRGGSGVCRRGWGGVDASECGESERQSRSHRSGVISPVDAPSLASCRNGCICRCAWASLQKMFILY